MTQKFHKGDLVRVAKDLGRSMSHFTADIDAIIIGSHQDRYGGGNTTDYTLYLKGQGQRSWYCEDQLELLEVNRIDLLDQWEIEMKAEAKEKGDIDWIFEHGSEVLKDTHGATVSTLAKGLGINNLWGSHGEGLSYYENSMRVLCIAKPFLQSNDKAGWLELCEKVRLPTVDYHITGKC